MNLTRYHNLPHLNLESRILSRRLLLNLLLRPLLILQVQSDLALVHCPSINGNNPEGETDKQTNKQTSRGGMCGGVDAGGGAELHSMWSPICNVSEYAEVLQRCFRGASEKHGVQCAWSSSATWISTHIHQEMMSGAP